MTEVKISMRMQIDDNFVEELKKIVDHKIDSLIDLDSFNEIKSIYKCKMKIIEKEEQESKYRYICGFVDPINFDVHYMKYFSHYNANNKIPNGIMVENPLFASRYISINDFEKDYGEKLSNRLIAKPLTDYNNIVKVMSNEPYNLFILKTDTNYNIKEMYVLKEEK